MDWNIKILRRKSSEQAMEQRFKPLVGRFQRLKFNNYTICLSVNFLAELPGRLFSSFIYILGDSYDPPGQLQEN